LGFGEIDHRARNLVKVIGPRIQGHVLHDLDDLPIIVAGIADKAKVRNPRESSQWRSPQKTEDETRQAGAAEISHINLVDKLT
jgi:hypothetical protein